MGEIAIVDYGAGNLRSVQNSLNHLGVQNRIADSAQQLDDADGIILPGVGAFPDAMQALEKSKLLDAVKRNAIKKPFMGICLGMQMLFEYSEEMKHYEGLGLLRGGVSLIETSLKLPQIGWNTLTIERECPITNGLKNDDSVYFVHSFRVCPEEQKDLVAWTDYGTKVPAIAAKNLMFGCQFHPEKSGETGLRILRNFADIVEGKA